MFSTLSPFEPVRSRIATSSALLRARAPRLRSLSRGRSPSAMSRIIVAAYGLAPLPPPPWCASVIVTRARLPIF